MRVEKHNPRLVIECSGYTQDKDKEGILQELKAELTRRNYLSPYGPTVTTGAIEWEERCYCETCNQEILPGDERACWRCFKKICKFCDENLSRELPICSGCWELQEALGGDIDANEK